MGAKKNAAKAGAAAAAVRTARLSSGSLRTRSCAPTCGAPTSPRARRSAAPEREASDEADLRRQEAPEGHQGRGRILPGRLGRAARGAERPQASTAASASWWCISVVGAGLALAVSEDLRKKVLDALFGAEEEFEYSATTAPRGHVALPGRGGESELPTARHPEPFPEGARRAPSVVQDARLVDEVAHLDERAGPVLGVGPVAGEPAAVGTPPSSCQASRMACGSMDRVVVVAGWISKCACGGVGSASPVLPMKPSSVPALTSAPSRGPARRRRGARRRTRPRRLSAPEAVTADRERADAVERAVGDGERRGPEQREAVVALVGADLARRAEVVGAAAPSP